MPQRTPLTESQVILNAIKHDQTYAIAFAKILFQGGKVAHKYYSTIAANKVSMKIDTLAKSERTPGICKNVLSKFKSN